MSDDTARPPQLSDVDVEGDPQLADAVRRIIGLTRTSIVDDAARAEAMQHLASAADILGAAHLNGPYWQTGLSALEQFRLTGDPTAVFPFSPASGLANPIAPRIALSVDRDGGSSIIRVRDEGAGLSPEDLTRLFGRFQRLSAKPTGGETSTGLGLSIVKRIVDLHGGTISAESAGAGLGTSFIVVLPPP